MNNENQVSKIIFEKYGIQATPGKKNPCPFCGHKTFSIKQDDSVGKCFRPDCNKSISAKNKRGRGQYPRKFNATTQPAGGCTLEQYAEDKKLPIEFLKSLGLRTISYISQPAIRIPYYDKEEKEAGIRFRTALKKSDEADNRFKWKSGTKVLPYGLWRLGNALASGFIILVEGESDAHTLWFHKIPALGIPGAQSWKEQWAEYLKDIEKVYIVVEPDKGGEAVKGWLNKSTIRDKSIILQLSNAKDPSSLYLSNPETFLKNWKIEIEKAIPWIQLEKFENEKLKNELFCMCNTIARDHNILEKFIQILEKTGVVGEARAAKLIYLAVTSRLSEKIVSLSIKGPSSSGKSFLTERVFNFFPLSAYYSLTAMSERALAYSEEPISHRFLVIYEAAGLRGDFSSYLIRSLLSEGRVRYETVEKTSSGLKSRFIEREGPTGLIVTTTAITLHPENETRLLTIPVNDTADQTRSILISIASEENKVADFSEWIAFQEWLEYADHVVSIPYAKKLASLIPPIAIRLRRDFTKILSLIKSHAILHQINRERDEKGMIIASLEDYAIVRELVAELIGENVDVTISNAIRETIQAVTDLNNANGSTVKEIAEKLKLDKSTAWRRVKVAIEKGYLKNMEEKKNRPAKICLDNPLPKELKILPNVDELSGCMVANDLAEDTIPPSPVHSDNKLSEKCYVCGSTDYWKKDCGEWVCNVCHPRP